jgi:nucleotide-binding universal stress UspA family protein
VVSESIIGGIDTSERSPDVLRAAVPPSSGLNARLVLLHVAQVPTVPGASGVLGAHEELRDAALVEGYDLVERVADDFGVPRGTELAVELGDPVDRIAAVARDGAAQFIVVASRGLGERRSAVLGSGSGSLAATAPCPVIVVPPGARGARRCGSFRLEAVRGER